MATGTATPTIADFLDPKTGTFATAQQISDALITGNYGGLTPIGMDGNPVPANSPIDQSIISGLPARFSTQPTNWLMWGGIAFAVWYLFLGGNKFLREM